MQNAWDVTTAGKTATRTSNVSNDGALMKDENISDNRAWPKTTLAIEQVWYESVKGARSLTSALGIELVSQTCTRR
eukprot:766451-Hanusia_phi.AAC.5